MIESAPLDLRGRSLAVAIAIGAVLLVGALWAAKLDWDSDERYSLPLDIASASYKILAAIALLILGHRLASRAMYLLAALVLVLLAGSLFVNSDWSDTVIDPVADALARILPVGSGLIHIALIFIAAGAIAGLLVWQAWRAARDEERRAVLIIIVLLAVVGLFLGPINAISTQGWNREWLFAEDFGQVVGLAVLAAYVWGLVARTGSGRAR